MSTSNNISIELVREPKDVEEAVILLSELNDASPADTKKRLLPAQAEGMQVLGLFGTEQRKLLAVATFRFCWRLYCGRTLYIDDFIVARDARFHGFGSKLFHWLIDYAKASECVNVTLDTGVRVFGAHKFYHAHGMRITSHHMTLDLSGPKHYAYPPGTDQRSSTKTPPPQDCAKH